MVRPTKKKSAPGRSDDVDVHDAFFVRLQSDLKNRLAPVERVRGTLLCDNPKNYEQVPHLHPKEAGGESRCLRTCVTTSLQALMSSFEVLELSSHKGGCGRSEHAILRWNAPISRTERKL